MPVLRGIDVKLVTVPAKQIIPEYPHPDGTSLRLLSRQEAATTFHENLSSASLSPSVSGPALPTRKVDPKSSVYIATQPGSQFIIAYDINNVPDGCKYMNFKVFINGRHIVTCGRDLQERRRGVISRTLWVPSADLWEPWAGIEGRQFMFLPDDTTKSAAEDGGLIEVRVHRAEARTLLAPALREFRQTRQYGIATPSTGLIDKPEEVDWYQYKLIDPIDIPYAKFYFHYRSIESLKELHLVPQDAPNGPKTCSATRAPQVPQPITGKVARKLSKSAPQDGIPPMPKPTFIKGLAELPKKDSLDEVKDTSRSSTPETSFLWLDGATDDRPVTKSSSRDERQRASLTIRAPTERVPSGRRENATSTLESARSRAPSLALQRPPPDLPREFSAPTKASKSPAPSLSPSLKESVDRGSFDDGVEIAETHVVRYNKILEKPTLLDVSPARVSLSAVGKAPTGRNTDCPSRDISGDNHQATGASPASENYSNSSSERGNWSDPQNPAYATGLSPRPLLSFAQRRAQRQNQQLDSPSRPRAGSHDGAVVEGSTSQEQRRRPESINVVTPTYRGTDTTMQSQVQRSPRRERPTDNNSQHSRPSLSPRRPNTYSALRDLGAQMFRGVTFRRSAQAQARPSPDNNTGPHRITQFFTPPRHDSEHSSRLSRSPRHHGPITTPIRAAYAEQRYTPRNAPAEPRGGVSWEEVVRQSPRHNEVIDQMIDQLNRSDLNRSDSFKENRPPPDHFWD